MRTVWIVLLFMMVTLVMPLWAEAVGTSSSQNFTVQVSIEAEEVIPPGPTPSGGDDVSLESFYIDVQVYSAFITFSTSPESTYTFRWGTTREYEMGEITESTFATQHTLALYELQPGETYYYELIGKHPNNLTAVLKRNSFTTQSVEDFYQPSNVSNFFADIVSNGVRLQWDNPADTDFEYVRIVRNDTFYPSDPYDGFVVYQGDGTSAFDAELTSSTGARFYTAFVYDQQGNISSGATTEVFFLDEDGEVIYVPDNFSTSTDAAIDIDITDVVITQRGRDIYAQDGQFTIDNNAPFIVAIPYDALPEHLKTIRVTFSDPLDSERTFSFLLRINADKSAYEAMVSPLSEVGVYPLSFSIYDFQTYVITTFEGSVLVEKYVEPIFNTNIFPKQFEGLLHTLRTIFILLLPLLVLLILFWVRSRRKKEEES